MPKQTQVKQIQGTERSRGRVGVGNWEHRTDFSELSLNLNGVVPGLLFMLLAQSCKLVPQDKQDSQLNWFSIPCPWMFNKLIWPWPPSLTVWQFVEFLWQLRKVRMLQCLVGAESLLRIELQERVRYRLALDDVVQPWKIVTQFPWSIETCNCNLQKKNKPN